MAIDFVTLDTIDAIMGGVFASGLSSESWDDAMEAALADNAPLAEQRLCALQAASYPYKLGIADNSPAWWSFAALYRACSSARFVIAGDKESAARTIPAIRAAALHATA
jgi:hypothetical protein